MRKNEYFRDIKLPCVPGIEAVGVVEKTGAKVQNLKPGDRVGFHHARGTYAEYALSNASEIFPIPSWMSDETATLIPVQGFTAYHLLFTAHKIQPDDWVLIHAASGGVGTLATQMAKLAGARVIATTSSEDKARFIKKLGADEVVLYTQKDFAAEAKRITKGHGVDLVLDAVGKVTLKKSLDACAPFGHVILYGWASGKPEPLDPLRLLIGSKKISGLAVRDGNRDPARMEKALHHMSEWFKSGKISAKITPYPLKEAARAQKELESRATTGKLILRT
jgi:NADPH2:quinone reductase